MKRNPTPHDHAKVKETSTCSRRICSLGALAMILLMPGCVAPSQPIEETPKQIEYPAPHSQERYSFLVAGHAYGAHRGDNAGLYPDLYLRFTEYAAHYQLEPEFLVLAGDIVRHGYEIESWETVGRELESLGIEGYYVMGNHDVSDASTELFREKYGETYYSFDHGSERFIILDCMLDRGSITGDQLEFLAQQLDAPETIRNVFVFTHELIWAHKREEFAWVRHNFGDYSRAFETSNFWDDVFPLLSRHEQREVYFVSGDVGGSRHAGAAPAVLARKENVTFLATGMGEVREENFLRVGVGHDGQIWLDLIPLDPEVGSLLLDCFSSGVDSKQIDRPGQEDRLTDG